MDLKNINLSEFIRYILTGFNFILFILVLPLMYLVPEATRTVFTDPSFLSIALLSIAFGYMLDILKVYEFAPKFKQKNIEFRKAVAEVLGIPDSQAASYVSLVYKLWGKYSFYDLERRRSEWALSLYTGVILSLATFIWAAISIYKFLVIGLDARLTIPILAALLSFACATRLFKLVNGTRERLNQDFMIIASKNKPLILQSWKLQADAEQNSKKE